MLVHIHTSTIQRMKWHQFVVRFFFGGAITVIAGLIARHYGPALGGLFLAFPAIFPAAATLTQTLEEEKKHEKGLRGKSCGISAAGVQASGTALGSLALAAFAILFWLSVERMSLTLLFPSAIVAWSAVAVVAWFLRKRVHLFHRVRPVESRFSPGA